MPLSCKAPRRWMRWLLISLGLVVIIVAGYFLLVGNKERIVKLEDSTTQFRNRSSDIHDVLSTHHNKWIKNETANASAAEETEDPTMTNIFNSTAPAPAAVDTTSTSNESQPSSNDHHTSLSSLYLLQTQANNALAKLNSERIFDTVVSDHSVVLQRAYPMSWKPGTLAELMLNNNNNKPVEILVLGGSLTSASARNCSCCGENESNKNDADHLSLDGRYTNILQRALDQSGIRHNGNINSSATEQQQQMPFHVVNMAQGGRDSAWCGLYLDELVDVANTDVIVWAFAVNDHHGFNPNRQDGAGASPQALAHRRIAYLDFWFRRVHGLFQQHQKDPPPILLLYLWEYGIGNLPKEIIQSRGLEASPLNDAWELIRQYRDLGWNIQVINVGAGIDPVRFSSNPSLMLEDLHHPGCLGTHIIANMIQYALYSNLATFMKEISTPPSSLVSLPRPPSFLHRRVGSLTSALFQEDVTVVTTTTPSLTFGSLTNWIPNQRNESTFLHNVIGANNLTQLEPLIENVFPQAVSQLRADRKLSYNIPPCQSNSNHSGIPAPLMTLTLLEPSIVWLGLDMSEGTGVNVTISHDHGEITVPVTSAASSSTSDEQFYSPVDWIVMWLHLPDIVPAWPSSSAYTVSFCKVDSNMAGDIFLHGLVALMETRT